jgi:hypothetical protein
VGLCRRSIVALHLPIRCGLGAKREITDIFMEMMNESMILFPEDWSLYG